MPGRDENRGRHFGQGALPGQAGQARRRLPAQGREDADAGGDGAGGGRPAGRAHHVAGGAAERAGPGGDAGGADGAEQRGRRADPAGHQPLRHINQKYMMF